MRQTFSSLDERIRHARPAGTDWLRALPLGNGRMGAMVFGNPDRERIQLNEDTFYALEPDTSHVLPTGVKEALPGVVDLLKQGRYREAEAVVGREWLGRSNAPYLPLADLWLEPGHAEVTDYTHELSLSDAVAVCRYAVGDTRFTREVFLSHPDQVLAMRWTADRAGALSFSARVDSPHTPTLRTRIDGDRIVLRGQGPGEALRRPHGQITDWGDEHKYPAFYQRDADGSWSRRRGREDNILYADAADGRGMFFEVRLRVLHAGGTLSARDGRLQVEGADEAVLLLSAATSFNGAHNSPSREGRDPAVRASRDLDAAARRSFADLKHRHRRDHAELFSRVELGLGEPGAHAALPTDERVARYREGNDPTLPALYYNFSRYLMIAGSRPGTEPLNLQGIWNPERIPPWNGGYTTNINAEMNYWDVLRANLAECHEPFLRMVRETHENGKKVAAEMFGFRGWCLFHNLSIWHSAAPVDGVARTSWWPVGAGWFCQHLWHHFLYTRDRAFLTEAFPVLRDAALFYCDWLIDRGDGTLVTPVSTSPENAFVYTDEAGHLREASVSMGSTMDMAIIRETFANTLSAAEELAEGFPEAEEIRNALRRLPDYRVAANGTLMEWSEPFGEADPEHRHLSHLYGFFPGEEITPEKRPELVDAVRATLERRGDGASGWSMAWKLAGWARLGDDDRFQRLLRNLLTPERTAPNLFCLHPPFQIDGNFGAARAITEALVQDHRGIIDLLPALPPDWPEGRARGLRVRGNAELDLDWRDAMCVRVEIRADTAGTFHLRCGTWEDSVELPAGGSREFRPGDGRAP